MNEYFFTVENLSLDRLELEIRQSIITVALLSITANGSAVTITFKASLSQIEQDELQTIVASHSGLPLPENTAIKIENSDSPIVTSQGPPLNSDCMEPWGCEKGYVVGQEHNFEITLSNKNGNTFDYVCSQPLAVGNYVFQDRYSKRAWIKEFTATTLTFSDERPVELAEGTSRYVEGHYRDVVVVDWKPLMYLWGLYFNARQAGFFDFLELSVVDYFSLYPGEALEASGFEQNGEYLNIEGQPAWTKYYDEQWAANLKVGWGENPGVGTFIPTPDGAPGELYPGLVLRLSYFTSKTDTTETDYFIDYSPTSK